MKTSRPVRASRLLFGSRLLVAALTVLPLQAPAQEWPARPGPRAVRVWVHYPGGRLEGVTARTGMMLTLHNWGGTDCVGTADPRVLAREFDVVAVCVNYLQSGREESLEDSRPYDFGWLQALDALRAVAWVQRRLESRGLPFATSRLYATGGSGGANVALMANKLAPRSFAGVIALSGMNKLSNDIAYGEPGGSPLSARWSRAIDSPNYLAPGAQEIRFVGHPGHLATMKRLGASARVVVVHGVDDATCSIADAREMVANFGTAGLEILPVWVDVARLDGGVFRTSDHSLGDRTQIVLSVAGEWLRPDSPRALVRMGSSDFERREDIRYATSGGAFVISYREGIPEGRFVPTAP